MLLSVCLCWIACSSLSANELPLHVSEAELDEPTNYTHNIVGGRNADPRKYKFQVVVFDYEYLYGGTLLDAQTVLTAAHCVYNRTGFVAFAAVTDLFLTLSGAQVRNEQMRVVDRIIMHPAYIHDIYNLPLESDIAILKLQTPFEFNRHVGDPVVIPNLHLEKRAKRIGDCWAVGFGLIMQSPDQFPRRLQEIDAEIRSQHHCRRLFTTNSKLMCINEVGKNVCLGDSGGPLVCFVNQRPVQMGIVSFTSLPCADGIGGFVRAKSFRKWIRQHL